MISELYSLQKWINGSDNIVCITGEEMKTALSGYLDALVAQDPKAVGGKVPGDDFYYIGK